MKVITSFTLGLCFTASHAWTLPSKEVIQKAASIATVSAILSTAPLVANADVDFTGSYADPFHVNCQRVISVKGTEAILSGTDGNPGCPADGSGKTWQLAGKVEGNFILVDFTPKGGPANLKGVWDDDSTGAGIKWPDGNKWTLKN